MIVEICAKHGLPLKWRKDRKGKFCPLCIDPKGRSIGPFPQKKH